MFSRNRFRPVLQQLESREVPSATLPESPPTSEDGTAVPVQIADPDPTAEPTEVPPADAGQISAEVQEWLNETLASLAPHALAPDSPPSPIPVFDALAAEYPPTVPPPSETLYAVAMINAPSDPTALENYLREVARLEFAIKAYNKAIQDITDQMTRNEGAIAALKEEQRAIGILIADLRKELAKIPEKGATAQQQLDRLILLAKIESLEAVQTRLNTRAENLIQENEELARQRQRLVERRDQLQQELNNLVANGPVNVVV